MAQLKNGSIIRVSSRTIPAASSKEAQRPSEEEEIHVDALDVLLSLQDSSSNSARESSVKQAELLKLKQLRSAQPLFEVEEENVVLEGKDLVDHAILLKEDGNALYKQGNFLGAALRYTNALETACPVMGVRYWLKFQPEVLSLSSNRSLAYFQLALIAKIKDDKAEFVTRAWLDASWCIDTNSAFPKGYIRLGTIYEHTGQQEEAMNIYKEGLQECPGNKDLEDALNALMQKPKRQDGPLRFFLQEPSKRLDSRKEITDLAWLESMQTDQRKLNQLGMKGKGFPLPPMPPMKKSSPLEIFVNRLTRVKYHNWTSILTEVQQCEWLRDCYRLRETRDSAHGVNRGLHFPPCHTLDLLPFLMYCHLLREQKLLPKQWSWENFIKRVSRMAWDMQPVLFGCMLPMSELRLTASTCPGVNDDDMLDFTEGVYGCKVLQLWPGETLRVRVQVREQWERWQKTKSPEVFQAVGGLQVWEGLLSWKPTCDCEARNQN